MKDILLDENQDLVAVNGDAAFGESAQQEMVLMMLSEKGDLKSDAGCGLGLRSKMKSNTNLKNVERDIIDQSTYCKIKISETEISNILKVFV